MGDFDTFVLSIETLGLGGAHQGPVGFSNTG